MNVTDDIIEPHPLVGLREVLIPVAGRLDPPERLSVTEWADRYRVLSSDQSAEPGRWRTSRTPYLMEIQDCFSDYRVRSIVVVASARVGKSECMKNMVLYALDRMPAPILYVLPVEADALDEANSALRKSIEQCPRTAAYILQHPFVVGSVIHLAPPRKIRMAWAKAARTMVRVTVRFVFFDEVDNCEKAAGTLGDTFTLAEQRTTTYGHRGKTVAVSTPSTPEGSAWREYLASDQRQYYVPCPFCGHYQVLAFPRLTWPKDRTAAEIARGELAWYPCEACEERIGEDRRMWMIRRGFWLPKGRRPTQPLPLDNPAAVADASRSDRRKWRPEVAGPIPLTRRVGFHLWAAYSPFVSFGAIAQQFLDSKGDPEKMRIFCNAVLGEPFTDKADDVAEDDLRKLAEGGLPRGVLPPEAMAVGVGADVQSDHCYYTVRAYGSRRRSWTIAEGTTETLDELYEVASSWWERPGMDPLRARFLAVDSGHRTDEIYEFARRYTGVYPVKGVPRATAQVRPSRIEYTFRGKVRPDSMTIYLVDVGYWKDALYRMARVPPGEPGHWRLHADISEEYLRQVTAEQKVWLTTRKRGRVERQQVWVPKRAGAANHWLDTEVYVMALAELLGLTRLTDPGQAPPPESPRPAYGRGPLGWRPRITRSTPNG